MKRDGSRCCVILEGAGGGTLPSSGNGAASLASANATVNPSIWVCKRRMDDNILRSVRWNTVVTQLRIECSIISLARSAIHNQCKSILDTNGNMEEKMEGETYLIVHEVPSYLDV
jgi:hypothetical protein